MVMLTPLALPSFFHIRVRLPSLSKKVLASMETPRLAWHTSAALAPAWKGPVGAAAVATPTHCLLLAWSQAVKYIT